MKTIKSKSSFYLNRLETKHCLKSVRGSLQSQILSRKALNQSGITTVTANPFSVKAIGSNISVGCIVSGLSCPYQWPQVRPTDLMKEYIEKCRVTETRTTGEESSFKKPQCFSSAAAPSNMQVWGNDGNHLLTFELLRFSWTAISWDYSERQYSLVVNNRYPGDNLLMSGVAGERPGPCLRWKISRRNSNNCLFKPTMSSVDSEYFEPGSR